MIEWIVTTLKDNLVLAVYLAIALGYWIGSFKFGSFSLGSVTGVLLAGLLVGQLGMTVGGDVKTIFYSQ